MASEPLFRFRCFERNIVETNISEFDFFLDVLNGKVKGIVAERESSETNDNAI